MLQTENKGHYCFRLITHQHSQILRAMRLVIIDHALPNVIS